MDKLVSAYPLRGGASVLALNAADNRLIAAGQQSKTEGPFSKHLFCVFFNTDFLLFAIETVDNTEQFVEIYDFRNTPNQNAVLRWSALQPKDVAWSPSDGSISVYCLHLLIVLSLLGNCFATASGTNGYLYIWDASRRMITRTLNIHTAIINRILFHPTCKQ